VRFRPNWLGWARSSGASPTKNVLPERIADTHIAQMLGYLNITGLEVALLLNFKEAALTWKRVVRGNHNKPEMNHGLHG
jgi:hypothetical protein